MSGQTDTMTAYAIRRLDHWGHEFSMDRDVEYLGYARKNILAVLMEHRGMPARATGFKPIETDALAQQVENVVTDLARENRTCANVLRAYYGGRGRRNIERYETALMLITSMGDPSISLRSYHNLRKTGEEFVAERLVRLARVA